jgi:glycosyltransferase involved in cell wall biosynthesis
MLQALTATDRVTVLSWEPIDVPPINRFFGTSLGASDFDTVVVPRTWRFAPDRLPVPAALLRSALLMRYTRRLCDGFDVIVGAHNETDFGRRGIQYVNYPTYLRPRPDVDYRWYHRAPWLLESYYRIADRVADFSVERMKRNLTLANSQWTAARIKRFLGVDAQTLYPPVTDLGAQLPWTERRTGFLALGRISREKEYERSMRILAKVRRHVPNLTFTIVGTVDRHASRYMTELRHLARSLGSWIDFRQNLSRDQLRAIVQSHRYGIHGMREEHFGMAPAEMVHAGCIVWVPRGGGQIEIVGDEPGLLYASEDEAAEKITRVLGSASEQVRMREHLAVQSQMFGADRFMADIRSIVAAFRE